MPIDWTDKAQIETVRARALKVRDFAEDVMRKCDRRLAAMTGDVSDAELDKAVAGLLAELKA